MDIKKGALYTLTAAYLTLVGVGAYGLVWEAKQPKQEIKKAKVCRIEKTNYLNDLHWSSRGTEIYIDAGKGCWRIPIKFSNNWDSTIKEGDLIDIVIKQAFEPFGLEEKFKGISVKKQGGEYGKS